MHTIHAMSVMVTVLHSWSKARQVIRRESSKSLGYMHTWKYKYKHERKTEKNYFRSTAKIILTRRPQGNTTTSFTEAMFAMKPAFAVTAVDHWNIINCL